MKTQALAVFRLPPERLNCAQAILHGYQTVTGDRGMTLADFAASGGGRAPDGTCGALHAACVLAPQAAAAIQQEFADHLGATRCRELKTEGRSPCQECVGFAAELLHRFSPERPASA